MPARRFVPWSLPTATGMAAGVATCAWQPAPSLAAWATALALAAGLARGRRVVLLVLVGGLLGAGRYALWQARPDRVAPLLGSEGVYRGESDGHSLRLARPHGLRLALVPDGVAPAGWVTVRGRVARAPGKRNPGGFDYRGYLERRGIEGQLFAAEVVAASPRRPLLERFRLGATAGLAPRQAALMEAMTLGVRQDLGDLRRRFAAAGLAHVLALSGLHVGVLVAALARLLAPLGLRRYPLLAAATVGYVALVGASPSVLRAAVMVLAALAGPAAGYGRIRVWPSLALAALVSLLLAPAQLLDPSFQLSYLAVSGMLLFAPPLLARLPRGRQTPALPEGPWPARPVARRLVGALSRSAGRALVRAPARERLPALVAGAAAQLPSLSLVAGSFGRIPLAAPLVNLVAVPLAALLVPLGFGAALLGLLSPAAAAAVNHVSGPLASLLVAVATLGARLPHLGWGEVAPLGHACFALAVGALALAVHGRLRPWRALLVVLGAGAVSAGVPPGHPAPEVVFLDVGQGDATLIRLPGRVEVLVDGGGTPFSDGDLGEQVVLPALRALDVRALDVVVATHADLDHVEGLLTVLQRIPVGTLVMGPPWPSAAVDARLRAIAASRGIPIHRALRGERWRLGRGRNRAELDVLHPGARALPTSNENSIALLLRYGGAPQVLMLGDAPASVERSLAVPHVPVLKVAHHGSRFSTSEALLRAARPALAVVSVGRNHYGHPDPGVLERLSSHGAEVRSTLAGGALRLALSADGPGPLALSARDARAW
ncbi:MAG: ComEC/Rec2 family competence protein [Deinococcales bacterium]